MADAEKTTEDPNFQGGVMSPKSQQSFAEMRRIPPQVVQKHKLILDEDSFEQTFLRCLLCKERFDMGARTPRLLPCHHTFCFHCIQSFYQKEEDYRRSLAMSTSSDTAFALSIPCPTCKSTFISTEEGLRQLTTDHRIVQLLDFVGHTDRETIVFCPNHAHQPLNFFCEKCVHPICRDCTVLDHKQCSEDKLVIDLVSAKEKYTPALDEGVASMEKEIEALAEKKTKCESLLENCHKGDDTLTLSIKESFAKLRTALDEREAELLGVAKGGNPASSKESIEDKIQKFSEKQDEVNDIKALIKKAKSVGTVQALYTVYKRLKDYQTEEGINEEDVQKSSDTTSTFSSRDEATVLTRIKNYGEIQSTSKQANGYGTYSSSLGSSSSYLTGSSRYSSYTSSYTPSRYTSNRSYKY